jgi:uncharacterized damage-inducible protein DinB
MIRQHLQTLARYNLWATQKLLNEHIALLKDADYRKATGLFFKSIHGTLNHLLVGEHLLWFRRFSEGISPVVQLNEEAEPDRALLAKRLLAGANAWSPLIESFDDDQLTSQLNYTTMRGAQASLPFVPTLMHVFNHATHHRGQITAALTMLGLPCPELDMVYFLQQQEML